MAYRTRDAAILAGLPRSGDGSIVQPAARVNPDPVLAGPGRHLIYWASHSTGDR
jgi:hypothetical protein